MVTSSPLSPPLSEFALIERYFAPLAAQGGLDLRDDAAFLALSPGFELVITVDACVSGVHFFLDDPPRAIAQKVLRTNLSDLAAKGAAPLGFLLTLGRADWQGEAWFAEFAAGLAADAQAFACPLYGGDTVRASASRTEAGFFLSITAFGQVPKGKMVRRQGGAAGDHLYVSGTIGDAAIGLRIRLEEEADWVQNLSADEKAFLRGRYLIPQPRMTLASPLRDHARAAMDISDGLVGDCAKLAQHLGRTISLASVPLSQAARAAIQLKPDLFETALTGGDDYEILAAIPPEKAAEFEGAAQKAQVPVTKIGVLTGEGASSLWLNAQGAPQTFKHPSYLHF